MIASCLRAATIWVERAAQSAVYFRSKKAPADFHRENVITIRIEMIKTFMPPIFAFMMTNSIWAEKDAPTV